MEVKTRVRSATRKVSAEELLGVVAKGGALLLGRNLKCPVCENVADILDYVQLEYSEKYADEVVAISRCKRCRHVFALNPNPEVR